jgi:hypothetical protein
MGHRAPNEPAEFVDIQTAGALGAEALRHVMARVCRVVRPARDVRERRQPACARRALISAICSSIMEIASGGVDGVSRELREDSSCGSAGMST